MLPVLALLLMQAPEPAQKPVLQNTGKPIRVPSQCTPADIRTFGLTCPPEQPCPVYLELADFRPLGVKLFLAGNLHTEATTLFSILLASDNEGKTWYEPFERVRSAGLDRIQFFDFETGWISGQILTAAPRDPFLLLTRDGGQTWRSRPVWDEGREGLIEAFRFDSKVHGMLWLDAPSGEGGTRYEAYESQTGGESWMLREASKTPLRKPERDSPPAGWRLRADGASRSYRVERQADGRWHPVASFLIEAGQCKEPEVELPPPPAEEPTPEVETPQEAQPAPAPPPPPAAPKKPPTLKKPGS